MRQYGLGESAAPARRVPTPDREALLKLLAEAGKQGSNLNQIARVLNHREQTGEPIDIPGAVISDAVGRCDAFIKQAMEILKKW